jgi:DNA-binding MarR family transcriptional regulator
MSIMTDILFTGYDLTALQIEYLQYIVQYKRDHDGNSPGQRQLARRFSVHVSTARDHLFKLSNKRLLLINEHGEIIVEDGQWIAPPHLESEF